MPMSLAYAIAVAEARSCLAALADDATDFDESIHFEHLLLDLDSMHEPDGYPSLYPLLGSRPDFLSHLEAAVDQMLDLGGEGLSLGLLLADAERSCHDERDEEDQTSRERGMRTSSEESPATTRCLGFPTSRTWCRHRRSTRSGRCRNDLARSLRRSRANRRRCPWPLGPRRSRRRWNRRR